MVSCDGNSSGLVQLPGKDIGKTLGMGKELPPPIGCCWNSSCLCKFPATSYRALSSTWPWWPHTLHKIRSALGPPGSLGSSSSSFRSHVQGPCLPHSSAPRMSVQDSFPISSMSSHPSPPWKHSVGMSCGLYPTLPVFKSQLYHLVCDSYIASPLCTSKEEKIMVPASWHWQGWNETLYGSTQGITWHPKKMSTGVQTSTCTPMSKAALVINSPYFLQQMNR